ncbi:DUF4442 domain-containing protein [bacterium]|nr:DUF4442 domain-containing protein [bacterium]
MNLPKLWNQLSSFPGGKKLFSRLAGWMIPYTGTMGADIEEFSPGYARISLRDRRRVRNHLRSIHAVALMNLAELTSGIASVGGLPPGMRGILVGFRIEYLKKARGRITATARFNEPLSKESKPYEVAVEIKNTNNDTVCRAFATWLIGPVT